MSTISLVPSVRFKSEVGNRTCKSQRTFFDIVVDGTSLLERVGKPPDRVSVLCVDFVLAETMKAVDRLLLRTDADRPNDRRSLFVCGECGDIGCGAITLRIASIGNTVIWKEFGYENDYEDIVVYEGYEDVGPFEFDRKLYESTFLDVIGILSSEASRSLRER